MTNFKFFKTIEEYRTFMYEQVFTHPDVRNHIFYRGLIEFIIEHRAPLFFSANKEEEFSHFTQYFNAILDRGEYYKNDFVRSMYFAHDFVHMLFYNPLRPRDLTFEKFTEILNVNEWVASNETETYTYFRIPGSRAQSLEYTIMYDLLVKHSPYAPATLELLDMRKNIIGGTDYEHLNNHPDAPMVFEYLRKYKTNNAIWCKLWYEGFPEIPAPYADERMCLPVLEYDKILKHYTPGVHFENQQLAYENNMFQNIRNLALLAKLPESDLPSSFADCEQTLAKLDGHIIMPEVAEHFHYTYVKSKNIGKPVTSS